MLTATRDDGAPGPCGGAPQATAELATIAIHPRAFHVRAGFRSSVVTSPNVPTPGQDRAPRSAEVDRLFPAVYDELRRVAHRHLEREATGHTFTTTDLVHQAYLTLSEQTRAQWTSRAHFMSVAATAMRRILVDHARMKHSIKHGGALQRVPLDSVSPSAVQPPELLVALDEALERLRLLDARQAQVVECRFFGGMTEDETALALGIAVRTIRRDWARAKSWLFRELYPDATGNT
jgi:RNA polymerase sigma-70 factor (ECF subfamily)